MHRPYRSAAIPLVQTAILAVLLLSGRSAPASAPEQIRIGGTGGALAVMNKIAVEYRRSHPKTDVTILPSLGSSGGIKAVLSGAIDICVSGRPLTDKEPGGVAREIGRTPFVFAVMKNAPASGLTLKEIEEIYAGRTGKWPDGKPIRIVLRPEGEQDTMLLKGLSKEMARSVTEALSREGMLIAVTDQDNAHMIERVPGSLGTITLGQILSEDLPFRMLSLNGVRPGQDTLARGAYPLFKTYYVITAPNAKPEVRAFVDLVFSARGRAILSRCGYMSR